MGDRKIQIEPGSYSVGIVNVELWLTHSFAPEWFADAVREATAPLGDVSARRREILFSVAFGESYIIEWIRDEVLNKDYQRLQNYFRLREKLYAIKKWQIIPQRLWKDKLISKPLKIKGKPYWKEWLGLVDCRNGLVHAVSSRPDSPSLSEEEKPLPPVDFLAKLEPGWAIKTAVRLVRVLHETMGTAMPNWISLPSGNP